MTVSYTGEVTTNRGISCFLKLLARWRGSIYKILWPDLIIFLIYYYTLNIMYRFFVATGDHSSKEIFEKIVNLCKTNITSVPLSFVLGFYVNLVMTRWWNQYISIPFPDNLAILVGACIKGQYERARIVRRTIVRYVCVTFTITLTMISPKVKKRFPTWQHFIDSGLLTVEEVKIIEDLDNEYPSYSKYWLPLAWSSNIVTRAHHEGLIGEAASVKMILDQLNKFRSGCGTLLDYDWISIPLVYTQVVTIATYTYFFIIGIGKQQIQNNNVIDLYFPIFPVIEFFFYMGWLKVAETLINPFGDDDDDFEVVWMIDRHIQICYLLVDKMHQQHPKLLRDQYWYETVPNSLPFTVASKNYMEEYPFPSTLNVSVKKSEQDLIVEDDNELRTVDSQQRRVSGYLWRRYGKKKQKRGSIDTKLRRIQISSSKTQNVATSDESVVGPLVDPQKITYSEEFEQLKKLHRKNFKQKLINYIELLKQQPHNLHHKIDEIIDRK